MDSNTSSDEKEVRQQCDTLEEVDAALALADNTGLVSKSRQSYFEASITLAAEVRRLREAKRVMSENEGRLHARIANLETKLARVDAALSTHRGYTLADKIKEALRDEPQLERACVCGEPGDATFEHRLDGPCFVREPKLPYNGY